MAISAIAAFCQQSLWVGQSYKFDVTSSVMGLTANMSWSTNGGYLSLSGSGLYRDITVTQYFSGTATVTCEWDYKLTGNGSYTHTKREVTISCKDNPVSISPTSMTLTTGETDRVSYIHRYNNQYTSAANAYFQSSDPSVARVDEHTGEVYAVGPGTTYINVYSKISSESPYCTVTVKKVTPTAISLPSSLEMTGGETKILTPTLTPSNAQASLTWTSSDIAVASVDSNGEIKARKGGDCIITVNTDNGLSASCNLKVNKGKLTVSSDTPDGWVEKGAQIKLYSSQPNATIYYTVDGSNPSMSSQSYSTPFTVEKDLVIKAFAVLDGFYNSDIETFKFDIRDFATQEVFPLDNQTVHKFVVPFVSLNQPIKLGTNSKGIIFRDNQQRDIPYSLHIADNRLYICQHQQLDDLMGYQVIIPEDAIISERGESNKEITLNFNTGSVITGISFGTENAAIIKSDGSLWVWGASRYGQLGIPGDCPSLVKTPVKIMDDVVDVQLSYMSGLALKSDGTVWSWGRNDSGTLGCGNRKDQPVPVKILSDVTKIYHGEHTSAAITTDGDLYMWGGNYYGQIGDGTSTTALSPKKVLSNVIDVSVQYNHAAAIDRDNRLYAWGHNDHNQIFEYTTYGQGVKVVHPGKFSSEYYATAVATTEGNTIYLDSDGLVNIWGINFNGIFGNGTNSSYIAYVAQTPIYAEQIKTGTNYILALDNSNDLWGWGGNDQGQVCGDRKNVTRPWIILHDVIFFSAGKDNAAAILSNGDVYAWGKNTDYQLLGQSSSSKVPTPTKIFSGPTETPVDSVDIICADSIIAPDMQTVFIPEIYPSDASVLSVSWSSSDDKVATVNEYGLIQGLKDGVAEITATVTGKNGDAWTVSSKITVDAKSSVPDNYADSDFRLYSEHGSIFVELSVTTPYIKVYDLNGRLIAADYNCRNAEFHGLNQGMYIVHTDATSKKIAVP